MTETTSERSALERLLRPLRREMNAEFAAALLRMQVDEEMQSRYDELADRNTQDQLTSEERKELESIMRANVMLSVLKGEARAFLQHPTAA